jgi:hypothetical protein
MQIRARPFSFTTNLPEARESREWLRRVESLDRDWRRWIRG